MQMAVNILGIIVIIELAIFVWLLTRKNGGIK